MSSTKRKIGVGLLAAIPFLILFAAIFNFIFLGQQRKPPKRINSGNELRTVETMLVSNNDIPSQLNAQGRLVAYDKIDLFAEVSGILKPNAKSFKIGNRFGKGATLLSIDDAEARLNLLSQKSNLQNAITQLMPDLKIDYPESFEHWKAYLDAFDLEAPIQAFPEPINEQEKFFIAARNLHSQYYSIRSAETRLSKYNIYAPFSGVITQTSINPGSLVRVGQKLGELMNTSNYELEATIRLEDLKYIKVGNTVQLKSDELEGQWTGRIKRISDQIDPGTQTVIVYIGVNGKNLREGMYLHGDIQARNIENALKIPRKLLVNQSQVYAVRDSALLLLPVEVVKIAEGEVIVRGLTDGTEILKNTISGAFEGMKVKIVNSGNGTAQAQPTSAAE